ncbi:D-aminoacyl-tRNA deacylase [Halopelagius fulvigenes]|uniref:D-aminoacyl-tRNA deacylase n=1 Tax=Halopelagius fulvigenes TaxID=1198324 RepID=A0ABD5U0M2_9EURY
MIAVVVSRADSASAHIGDRLLELADWDERTDGSRPDGEGGGTYYRRGEFELREFDGLHIELGRVADAFSEDPEFVAFVSRHAGETGPLLTAHFTGNFGPAEYGGEPGAFARACPNAQKRVVKALAEHAPEEYDVGIECTHHGPTDAGAPSMFVELGSGESEWEDPAGARAVAAAVLDLSNADADRDRQLVGFGGGHYAPRFTRIVRETDWAVGHVGADWQLDAMGDPEANRDVLRRAFEASDAEYAVVDDDRPELEAVLDELGYRVVDESWVREATGVPLDFLDRLESDLSPVEDGLRLGKADAAEYEVVSLPDELLSEAGGVDAESALAAIHDRSVAYETIDGGTKARGRAALPEEGAYDELVAALADVLREKYDSVERTERAVVARREAFDPSTAAELGVPEGPAFGKLSAGQPVDVGGKTVEPDDVRTEQRIVFKV